jgi:hypothetical protein
LFHREFEKSGTKVAMAYRKIGTLLSRSKTAIYGAEINDRHHHENDVTTLLYSIAWRQNWGYWVGVTY